jgi:hypothetical protein
MAAENQRRKIPDDILEEIYLKWANGKSLRQLEKEYHISLTTLSKYKQKLKWDERREKIQQVVTKRIDKSLATRKVRRAKLASKLQAEGLKKVKKGLQTEQGAIQAIRLGVEIEDQVYGDHDESTVITIKLPKGTSFGYRSN